MHIPSFLAGAVAGMLALWAGRAFRAHRRSLLAARSVRAERELGDVFTLRRELYPQEIAALRQVWGDDYGRGVRLRLEANIPDARRPVRG